MAKPNIEQGISTASSHLRWNVGSVSDLASSRVREAGSGHHGKSCKPLAQVQGSQEDQGDLENPRTRIMFATWNLGALNIMLKWWRLCQGDESTSVVCRNTGIWVLLNPTSSIFLWTMNANSISSVLKPRYYWQRIRKTKFLKSSASLTFLARSFFSSWSSARCFSPYLRCTHLKWTHLKPKRNHSQWFLHRRHLIQEEIRQSDHIQLQWRLNPARLHTLSQDLQQCSQ